MPLALWTSCILVTFYPAEPLELLLTILTLVFEETLFSCRPALGTPALAAAGNCFLCGPLPSDLARVTSALLLRALIPLCLFLHPFALSHCTQDVSPA